MSRYQPPAAQIITDITRKAFLAAGAQFSKPRLAARIEVNKAKTRHGEPAVDIAFAVQCVTTYEMVAADDPYRYLTKAIASYGTTPVHLVAGERKGDPARFQANITVALDREDLSSRDARSIAIDAITRAVYLPRRLVSPANVEVNTHFVDLAHRATLREHKPVYDQLDPVSTTIENSDATQALRSIGDWTLTELRTGARILDAERRSGMGRYDETRRENLRTVLEAEANRRGETLSPQRNERAIEALAERTWYIHQCAWATPDTYIPNPANMEAEPLDTLRRLTNYPETMNELSAYTGLHMTRERIKILQATLDDEHIEARCRAGGFGGGAFNDDYAHPWALLGSAPLKRPRMARNGPQRLYDETGHVHDGLEFTRTQLSEGARRVARAGFHAAAECDGQIRGGTNHAIETSLQGTRTIETYTEALAAIGRRAKGKDPREF